MVLQQESEIPLWGWCDPGEDISVTLGKAEATTTGDSSGTWRITLPAVRASTEPFTLRIEGTNTFEIHTNGTKGIEINGSQNVIIPNGTLTVDGGLDIDNFHSLISSDWKLEFIIFRDRRTRFIVIYQQIDPFCVKKPLHEDYNPNLARINKK